MKGVSIFEDEKSRHRIMQIDLDQVAAGEEFLEDLFDTITIEVRKNEDSLSWDDVKRDVAQP